MTQNNRERLRQAQAAAAKQQRLTRAVGVGAAVLAVLIIGVVIAVLFQNQGKSATAGSVTPPHATSDGRAIEVYPGKAKAGAPVVELFFDYQCPACGNLERQAGKYILDAAEQGDYQLIYRPMTFLDTNLRNDSSVRAANAAACYAEVGDYSAYHQAVFDNQPAQEGAGYTDDLLRNQLPTKLGTSGDKLTQFQQCYDTGRFKGFAQQTNTAAARDGVTGTPTIRVNGKDLDLKSVSAPDQFPAAVAKAAAGQ